MRLLTKTLTIVALTTLLFTACKKEVKQPEQDEISQAVKDKIFALGFGTSDIKIHDDGYLVEGDIIITPEHLNSTPSRQLLRIAETEQYHTFNLVTGTPRVIKVSISNQLPSSYVTALDIAIGRYNAENLSITFQRVNRKANISILKAPFWAPYLASAGFPTSNGNPYSQILVNSNSIGSQPTNTIATILAHELGHCIGFRHTDWEDRSFSCGGASSNEGQSTTGVGAVHIPGTPTGPQDPGSWMLACISSGADRPFNTNDQTALDHLY